MLHQLGDRVTAPARRLPWGWAAGLSVVAGLATGWLVWYRAGRPDWYRLVYRACYALRLRIWERDMPASELVELVEGPAALPPGRALDLGCGTGTDSVYLAQHGWDVIGIDMVERALAIARRRATSAEVAPTFLNGDVLRLDTLGIGAGFTLLLDFGCFHTLPATVRDAYVDQLSAVAAPGATMLLYGFANPPKLAPMRAGVTPAEVRERFDGRWTIVSATLEPTNPITVAGARVDRNFDLWCFRLRRSAEMPGGQAHQPAGKPPG